MSLKISNEQHAKEVDVLKIQEMKKQRHENKKSNENAKK
jgi:hypothetical protein